MWGCRSGRRPALVAGEAGVLLPLFLSQEDCATGKKKKKKKGVDPAASVRGREKEREWREGVKKEKIKKSDTWF